MNNLRLPLDLLSKRDNRVTASLPVAKKRKFDRRCRSEVKLSARLDPREDRVTGNKLRRLGRTSRTILNLFSKLKILKRGPTITDPLSPCDKDIIKKINHRDAGEAMSTRSTRGVIRKTPRSFNKIERAANAQSSNVLETISYDYEAAVSQPDLTGFFRKEDIKKMSKDDDAATEKSASAKECLREDIETKTKISEIHEDPTGTGKTIDESAGSVQSLFPKSEPIEKKTSRKLVASVKCPKTSRIPRARFTAFSRLPQRNKANKKSSLTRLTSAKSKCGIVGEAPQVKRAIETTQPQEEEIQDRRLSSHKLTLVGSVVSKSVFSEEKCSGVEADVELDADQEFTTSPENSPGRIISAGDPSVAAVLRVSKLSCACRSCNDNSLEVPGHRVNPDIWTDSRSSPEVGRYSASGRNGRPKTRRLTEIAKNRGYLNDSSDESDTLTSDFSICGTNRQKKMKNIENRCEIPSPVAPFAKPSVIASPAPRLRAKPRLRFSFFNTLFDIVFWPFLFLRPDR